MLKYLIIITALIVTLPFWLPTSLGGDTGYHFVLTDSMKGTLDPGAFVILRSSGSYKVGDAVGYARELPNGQTVTILHRIVGRLPDGNFLLKGDSATSIEEVAPGAVTGRLVFAIPALGFLPGAFRQAPLLLGGLLIGAVVLTGNKKKTVRGLRNRWVRRNTTRGKGGGPAKAEEINLFLPASLLMLLCLPFLGLPVAKLLPPLPVLDVVRSLTANLPMFVLLFGVMAITRITEVAWADGPQRSAVSSISGLSYGVIMLVVITAVPFGEIVESARVVLAF